MRSWDLERTSKYLITSNESFLLGFNLRSCVQNVIEIYHSMQLKLMAFPGKLRIGRYGDIRLELLNKEVWEIIDGVPVLV